MYCQQYPGLLNVVYVARGESPADSKSHREKRERGEVVANVFFVLCVLCLCVCVVCARQRGEREGGEICSLLNKSVEQELNLSRS
jgi:hypothetical protein